VRGAAVAALERMRAREAAPAIEAYRGTLSDQEQVRIDRVLRTLRSGEDSKVSALEKQVDELQTRLRELQGTIQRLEARVDASRPTGDSGED
jgi:hypothetical protein